MRCAGGWTRTRCGCSYVGRRVVGIDHGLGNVLTFVIPQDKRQLIRRLGGVEQDSEAVVGGILLRHRGERLGNAVKVCGQIGVVGLLRVVLLELQLLGLAVDGAGAARLLLIRERGVGCIKLLLQRLDLAAERPRSWPWWARTSSGSPASWPGPRLWRRRPPGSRSARSWCLWQRCRRGWCSRCRGRRQRSWRGGGLGECRRTERNGKGAESKKRTIHSALELLS